ncbi:MAG TPA: flavodoxin family protein [Thioalkalivibrio sp.]|nr:flavodoxin family protein [Thioalkalivibrio sp.]
MNILIVYAHPNPDSFNHAILERVQAALIDKGYQVRVRDLYAMGFDPVLSGNDLVDINVGKLADDVAVEQDMLRWATGLLFIYPVWWFDRPAILKGWFDRVLTRGFAFDYSEDGAVGLLTQQKAAVIMSTGGTDFELEGQDIEALLAHPVTEGTFKFCGIQATAHKVLMGVPVAGNAGRRQMLDETEAFVCEFF